MGDSFDIKIKIFSALGIEHILEINLAKAFS
jgi:hypothetical protein